jgi:hypothetical protein
VSKLKKETWSGHSEIRSRISFRRKSSCGHKSARVKARSSFGRVFSASLLFLLIVAWSFTFQSINNLWPYVLASDSPLQASVDFGRVIGTNNLSLGAQIHGYDNFPGKPTLRQKAQDIGFEIIRVFVTKDKGTEPCLSWNETSLTGVFDWSHIDPLVNSIFEIGAEPLLNVGAGEFPNIVVPPGMTKNYMGTRFPNPKSFGPYVVAIMRHLKSIGRNVEYWEIWRTPAIRDSSGYINAGIVLNYTKFFNVVQDYIHGVDPNALVSSDRTMYRAFFDIFVKSAKGVGFLSYMKYDAYGTPYYRPEGYNSGDKVMQAAGVLDKPTGGSWAIYSPKEMQREWVAHQGHVLPVVVVETNLNSSYEAGTDERIQTPLGSAWYAEALKSFILDGTVSTSIYHKYCSDESSLWGPNRTKGWGLGMIKSTYPYEEWYAYWTNYLFGKTLQVGNSLFYTSAQNNTLVSVLAWGNATNYFVVVIGKTNNTYSVDLQLNKGEVNTQNTLHVYRIDMQYNGLYSRDVNYSAPIRLTLADYSVNLVVISRSQLGQSPFLFEDGFESGNFVAWSGTSKTAGETALAVNTLAHHGVNSAKSTNDGSTAYERVYSYKTISALSEVYARGYFYVLQSGIATTGNRFYVMQLRSGTGTVAWVGWRQTASGLRWELMIRNGADYVTAYSTSAPALNGWYSVELHWKKGVSGGADLWIDGALTCSLAGKNTSAYGDVNSVRFGLPEIQNCGPTTIYCDCSVINNAYIGKGP